MKKVLITGISGFAGSFLSEYLLSQTDYKIFGTYLTESSLNNVSSMKDRLTLFQIDLLDASKVSNIVSSVKPDLVFHLAALTAPGESFNNPTETINNNIASEVNLLEAVKNTNLADIRILITSSADIYGKISHEDLPIDENTKLMPLNPYAVSKIAQDFLGLQYSLTYNMHIVRVRPFNHIGPRQSPNFVVASFAKQIVEIEKKKKEPILKVGNLDSKRDFTDVRDMVRAYLQVLEKGKDGEAYNIGSGISYKISDILNKLLSFSNIEIKIEKDNLLLRPSDTPELICDNSKISNLTGWKPEIPIDKTLKDTLDYWRNII